jgi:hypothetical protein
MRSAIRDLGLLALAYVLVWGVTWTMGDRSSGVFGVTASGTAYSFHPGVFLGGLPPTPWPVSDLPQVVAAVVGGIGLIALIARG